MLSRPADVFVQRGYRRVSPAPMRWLISDRSDFALQDSPVQMVALLTLRHDPIQTQRSQRSAISATAVQPYTMAIEVKFDYHPITTLVNHIHNATYFQEPISPDKLQSKINRVPVLM